MCVWYRRRYSRGRRAEKRAGAFSEETGREGERRHGTFFIVHVDMIIWVERVRRHYLETLFGHNFQIGISKNI